MKHPGWRTLCVLTLLSHGMIAWPATGATFEQTLIGLDAVNQQWPNLDGVNDQNGKSQRIAIIDTGIDYNHSGLLNAAGKTRVVAGVNFAPDALYGSTKRKDWQDVNGHGTQVTGIIGSSLSTAMGIAPKVQFVSVRVGDASGNISFSALSQGIDWVIEHAAQYRITAVNISLASSWTYLNELLVPPLDFYNDIEDGLATLKEMDIITSAASGNSGSILGLSLPAIFNEVISVGASMDSDDSLWSGSNRNNQLKLVAPGQTVKTIKNGGGVSSVTGTSYAAAHVTAAAVLAREAYQKFTGNLAGSYGNFQNRLLDLFQDTGEPIFDLLTLSNYERVDLYAAIVRIYEEFDSGNPGLTLPGDFNGDGYVDTADFSFILSEWGDVGGLGLADFNADGTVDSADFSAFLGAWTGSPESAGLSIVPEPATLICFATALLPILARRCGPIMPL